MTRVLSPLAIAVQACACAVVGAAKVLVNQSRVIALNCASPGGGEKVLTLSWCQWALTSDQSCGLNRAVAMASASCGGICGTRAIASSRVCAQASASRSASSV